MCGWCSSRPSGLEPFLPFLILPEVKDDANWYGGLTGKVPMNPLYVFYDGISGIGTGIDVNRDKVSRAEMSMTGPTF